MLLISKLAFLGIVLLMIVSIFFAACSQVEIVREKVCENRQNIKTALDILCAGTASAQREAELKDSLKVWMGLK